MGAQRKEGRQREKIAAFLVSVPSPDRQDAVWRAKTRRVLHRLWRVEQQSVLRCVGQPRVMRQGDAAALITAVLRCAVLLLGEEYGMLSVVTPVRCEGTQTAIEPRVLQLGLIALIRDNVRRGQLTVAVEQGKDHVYIRMSNAIGLVCRGNTLRLLKETASIHEGSLAVGRCEIVISVRLHRTAPYTIRVPTVSMLAQSLTSIPVVGLFPFIPYP